MNIFDLSVEEIDKKMKEMLSKTTPEELMKDLIKCGYERDDNIGDIVELNNELKNINYEFSITTNLIGEYTDYIDVHRKRTSKKHIIEKEKEILEAA